MIFYLNVLSIILTIVLFVASLNLFYKTKRLKIGLILAYSLLSIFGQLRWISYFSITLSTFDDYYWSFVEYLTLFIFGYLLIEETRK